jgi:hypothetical protein
MNESRDELDREINEKQEALVSLDQQMRDIIDDLKTRLSQTDMADVEALLKIQEGYHLMHNTLLKLKEERLAGDAAKQATIARAFGNT